MAATCHPSISLSLPSSSSLKRFRTSPSWPPKSMVQSLVPIERLRSMDGCSSSIQESPNFSHGCQTSETPKPLSQMRRRFGSSRDFHCSSAVTFVEEDLDLKERGASSVVESLSVKNSASVLDSVADNGASPPYRPRLAWFATSAEEERIVIDRGINGALVGFFGAAAIVKIFTASQDSWTGWTLFEIIRNLPRDNWHAYEAVLNSNPVMAKMMISGIVYTVGDWSAQVCEGRSFLDFDRVRMARSGLVGFSLHGSLSHHYYHFCEWLFPFQDFWVVPAKVLFDQTVWSALWNSIYYTALGLLRFEKPADIWKELKATFFPLLKAGWKLWPFAHLVTYGAIPVEQRLLWVDCVELVWVAILSMISNEQVEGRRVGREEEVVEEEIFATAVASFLKNSSEGEEEASSDVTLLRSEFDSKIDVALNSKKREPFH